MSPPRLVSNRCEPHVCLWFAPTFDLSSSLAATDTLRGASLSSYLPQLCVCVCVYVWVGVCVCACVFLMRRLHCVCESAFLFAPFTTEVASIIQQHIAEHNATHCIALSLPQESSVFICLLLDCFYAPIMFPAAPSPSPASSAHFICLRTLVMFPQLELRICQTAHFFLHSLVSVFFVSLLSYS